MRSLFLFFQLNSSLRGAYHFSPRAEWTPPGSLAYHLLNFLQSHLGEFQENNDG